MTPHEIDRDVQAAANRAGANGADQQARQAWRDAVDAAREAREATGAVSEDLQTLSSWLDGATLDSDTVLRLYAGLNPVERDQTRKAVAERLGVRVGTLDAMAKPAKEEQGIDFEEPEPWGMPVSGCDLLTDVRDVFTRYVAFSDEAATACALWVMHTYAFDAAEAAPILAVTSPEKRCGKSTLLSVLSSLVYRPAGGASFSKASVYRVIERYQPTLLIDEADTFFKDNDELRGVINSGHTRRMAHVWVCVGDNHEPTRFSTWAPKGIACIGRLPDTIADRSIEIPMRRKTARDDVERYRERVVRELETLRRMCKRWADDNLDALRGADPSVPAQLSDRAADSWAALLAIADAAGGDWPDQARAAAIQLSGQGRTDVESIGTELLRDIRDVFAEQKANRMHSADLVAALVRLEERPWATYHRGGKELSQNGLARLLKPFDIESKQVRIGVDNRKGYELSAFLDAFSRYLPDTNETTKQTTEIGETEPQTLFSAKNTSETRAAAVSAENRQNRPNQAGNAECFVVSDENGESGDGILLDLPGDDEVPF